MSSDTNLNVFCRGDINVLVLLKPYTSIIIMLILVVTAWVAVSIWLFPQKTFPKIVFDS
jgi:hypothetical protein